MSKEKLYKCVHCGETANAEEWNKRTDDEIEGVLGITWIEEIVIGNGYDSTFFICPNCGRTCYNDVGDISEN